MKMDMQEMLVVQGPDPSCFPIPPTITHPHIASASDWANGCDNSTGL